MNFKYIIIGIAIILVLYIIYLLRYEVLWFIKAINVKNGNKKRLKDLQKKLKPMSKKEDKEMLHKALDKLSPQYRQILWLVYFENFSNAEAATVIKKSLHNTETLLYRAKKSLKSELEKEGYVYEKL